MTAAQKFGNLLVAQMRDEFEQLRILTEEMFPRITPRFDDVFLVITVAAFFHALEQQTGLVALNNFIPLGSPNHFDDVPTRTPDKTFKLLNDFSVAAHRPVEPLQIAVHNPDDVIQTFARSERDGSE